MIFKTFIFVMGLVWSSYQMKAEAITAAHSSFIASQNIAIVKKEIWKDIKGYEGYYQASTFGRVRSINKNVIINQRIGTNGYMKIRLGLNGKRIYKDAHRLIAITFLSNPDNLPQISHEDNDKTNNNINNLKWCTASYNMLKANRELNINHARIWKGKFGYNHNRSKEIIQLDLNNNEIERFGSIAEAGRKLNVSASSISKSIIHDKVTLNSKFKYA